MIMSPKRKSQHLVISPCSKRKMKPSPIKALPNHLLIEILARVSSSSATDLFNCKFVCNDFLESANDDHILQRISLQNYSDKLLWFPNPKISSFLQLCTERGNPDALYIQGMHKFFSDTASAMEYLKIAAEKGHPEASYVYGMSLQLKLARDDSQLGLDLVKSCERKGMKKEECRRRIEAFVKNMWKMKITLPKKANYDHGRRICNCFRDPWRWPIYNLDVDGEDEALCETCKWEYEIATFRKIMRI